MIYFLLLLLVEFSLMMASMFCFARGAWIMGFLCGVFWSVLKYITNTYGERIAGDGL